MSKFILKKLHEGCIGVWYENDDIQACVGELSNDRGRGWQFHFTAVASLLTIPATAELKALAEEQVVLLKVMDKLRK